MFPHFRHAAQRHDFTWHTPRSGVCLPFSHAAQRRVPALRTRRAACYGTSLGLTRLGPRVLKIHLGSNHTILPRNAHADRPGNLGALPGLQQVCISDYAMQRATTHAEISPPCVPRCTPNAILCTKPENLMQCPYIPRPHGTKAHHQTAHT